MGETCCKKPVNAYCSAISILNPDKKKPRQRKATGVTDSAGREVRAGRRQRKRNTVCRRPKPGKARDGMIGNIH